MGYLENMSLHELAMQYKNYSDESALEELNNRDCLSKMTYDERMALRLNEEPDNQMLFEFAQSEGDNPSVKMMDEFDREFVADTFGPPTPEAKERLHRAKSKLGDPGPEAI